MLSKNLNPIKLESQKRRRWLIILTSTELILDIFLMDLSLFGSCIFYCIFYNIVYSLLRGPFDWLNQPVYLFEMPNISIL